MINTLNETPLHRTLKTLYQVENPGSITETPVGPYIADILCPDGSIIEIQTTSVSHLLEKCVHYMENKHKVTVVYPLPVQKFIETYSPGGELVRRKKSPKKLNIYGVFKELTGIHSILLNRNFTLHVLEVTISEQRRQTEAPVQSSNGRRRFLKDWVKYGKKLEEISTRHIFHGKKTYKKLLPKGLSPTFTIRELCGKIRENGINVKENDVRLMIWIYLRLGIVTVEGKAGRAILYRLCQAAGTV